MTTTTSKRGRGDGVSKLRAELDRYNNEICAIRSRKHIFESAEDTDNSAWDSAESVAPSLSPPDSPKSVVDRVHNILPANPKPCTVHHVFKAFVAGRPGPVGQEAEDGDDDCDSSFEGAVRISATTVFTANGGDFAYRGAAGPRPPKPRVDFGSPREPARELEEGGSPAAEPLEPLPEPFGAKNDDLCNKIVPIRPPAEAPADALVLGIFPSKILESANSLLLGLSNVNCQENSNGDADGGRKADNLNGGDGRSDAGALIVPTEGNADTGNDLDNTIAENREPRPSADGQRQDIYSSKCNSGRDLVVARRMASKIKSILQRVDARIHGSQTQTDAGNYSCRNQHGQSSSFSIGYSQNPNAILKMISDPGSHSILEKTGTSKQHDIPFPDQEWFETQLKDIREKHKSNEIPDPKVYLEHVVASLGGKDQVGYIDQFKCSVTRGISSLMNSNCIKCEPNEGCNICNQQEIELNKSSAIVHDLGKDVPVPALFTDAGHQRLTLEDLKQGEDLESKQVYMQNSSGTLGIHSDKNIQVGRAEVQGNNMTEDGGIQALAIPLQSLQFTTSKQIKDNHASDWVCDGEKRDGDEFHGNDQFLKECRRKVGNLLDGYRLLEKNVGGSKPPWHMQQ